MSQIPALNYAVVQNIQAQRQAAVDKERQVRREQALKKDMAAHEDEMEHQVESAEEIEPIHDEAEKQPRPKRQSPGHPHKDDDEPTHIDLTA